MDKRPSGSIIPSQGGMLRELTLRLKLIARLMGDRRVSFLAKVLPVASLAYLISPIDAVSLPIIGAVDDIAVLWMASYFFLEMCPVDVVKEHVKKLISTNEAVEEVMNTAADPKEDDVVDGEATDVK